MKDMSLVLNYDLREYYRINWSNEVLYKYRERMEKYYARIQKYIGKYKTKKLIYEDGCYNMDVIGVELTDMYELHIFLGNSKPLRFTLEDLIEYGRQLRYDAKYHTISFYMY